MGGRDTVVMSCEELKRLGIVKQAIGQVMTQREAAGLIGMSERQVRRLIRSIRQEGDKGIIHSGRGKPGNRRIEEEVKVRVLKLYGAKYYDFGPTLASEKLREVHGIRLSAETLRLWLGQQPGKPRPWQQRARPHRKRRERKQHFGEMVQMDGSHHAWLEDRGPALVLMGYTDDATSTLCGKFYDYEGTMPALDSFKRYIKQYGLPQSIYLDRHTTYRSTGKPTVEQQLRGQEPLSEFARAAKELGVRLIFAGSPQAKGRVERSFGTLQDRLVKEMRLAGIRTMDEANLFLETYLPKHNHQFAVAPARRTNLHRKRPSEHELRRILCIKTKRVLSKDSVIRYDSRFFQLRRLPHRRIRSVMVEEHLDGKLRICTNGTLLKWREIVLPAPKKPRLPLPQPERQPEKAHPPPIDHPWRRYRVAQAKRYRQKTTPNQ